MDFKTVADDLKIIRSTLATNLTARNITVDANDGPTTLAKKVALLNSTDTTIDPTDIYNGSTDLLSNRTTFRDYLATQLTNKGVTVNADEGPLTLAEKVNSILLTTNIVLETNKTELNTATDPTATLKATVTDVRGNPVKGVTVEFFSNNTSLSSSITNDLGETTYDYVCSDGGIFTLIAKIQSIGVYNNCISNNINLTVISYLYYDDCSVDKSSNYTNAITWGDTNNYTVSVTYNNSEKAYMFSISGAERLIYIPSLTGLDNITIECDIKKTSSGNGTYCGLGFAQEKRTGYYYGVIQSKFGGDWYSNGNWNGRVQATGSASLNTWYHVKMVKSGTVIHNYIYDMSGNLKASLDRTVTNGTNYYGISNGSSVNYFKNIKVYSN